MNIKAIGFLLAAAAVAGHAHAKEIVDNVSVDSLEFLHSDNRLMVSMQLGLENLRVSSGHGVDLVPWLVNGSDSLALPPVAVYGRQRYIYEKRNSSLSDLDRRREYFFLNREKPASLRYEQSVPYALWMDGATLSLRRTDCGCCHAPLLCEQGEIGRFSEAFFPELVYIRPKAMREKRRTLEGRAYIDFPVDQTVIYPDYRRNSIELAAIQATIDTIRNDRDARIDSVWLKGFASPESPYSHNTDLAKGRTEALRDHITRLYHFENVTMLTDYEPEDWAGLRAAVEKSNLANREEIIKLIDSDMEPDAKEARIRKLYPDDYRFMLRQFYPALRHTDYRVSYVIRTYNDPEEIIAIMHSQPAKLDQNEFYVAADALEPGSDEFTEVFETAVRMFPDDEVANLNAANAAIRRDDFAAASRYLARAGESPEADYARGALAIRRKEFGPARVFLTRALEGGIGKAAETIRQLDARLGVSGN